MPTLQQLVNRPRYPQTGSMPPVSTLAETIERLKDMGETSGVPFDERWLAVLGEQPTGDTLMDLVAGGGTGGGAGGGSSFGTWTSPGTSPGSGQSRGDQALWAGGEQTFPTFGGRGPEYRGPIIRRGRVSEDSPFQVPPVPGAEWVSSYGAPRDGGSRQHQGNDLMAPGGAPNYAVFGGQAEVIPGQGTAGNSVYVTNPQRGTAVYFHLDEFAPGLQTGDRVRPGDFLGTVGDTGNAVGGPPHTHFEYRPGGRGAEAVNPFGELTSINDLVGRAMDRYRPGLARYAEGPLLRDLLAGAQAGVSAPAPEEETPTGRRRGRSTSAALAALAAARGRGL